MTIIDKIDIIVIYANERKEVHLMKIFVCVGSSCHLKGSYDIVNSLKKLISENDVQDKVNLSASFCLGHCSKEGVTIKVEDEIFNVSMKQVDEFFKNNILGKLGE